jgi:hypothetical protein
MTGAACGPSIQSIHEGSVRFEHCYRLDLDPKIAPSHRHACWEQWLEVYSFGQSRDRLEHARKRVLDLAAGDPNPPSLNLESEEQREARQFYISTPDPVNVHAPPPPVAAAPTSNTPVAPSDACVVTCRNTRTACLARCGESTPAPPAPDSPAPVPPPSASGGKKEPPKPPEQGAAPNNPTAEESTDSACACEQDYKSCGARCFE